LVGENVTIGHQAALHGCTIGDGSLVGIQAVVMNGSVIGKNCLAGALIPEGKTYGDRKLILGSPAKVIRELTDQDIEKMHRAAPGYVRRKEVYKLKLKKLD
jgi:carbonic anhydrase/acetyltransferase-like protein (isoleucine patch superfamily)